MAEQDVVLLRRPQQRVLRKGGEHRLVDTGDQLAVDGDPDQQGDDALGDGSHVMQHVWAVRGVTQRLPPPLVGTGEIFLEHQPIVLDDHDTVHVVLR